MIPVKLLWWPEVVVAKARVTRREKLYNHDRRKQKLAAVLEYFHLGKTFEKGGNTKTCWNDIVF